MEKVKKLKNGGLILFCPGCRIPHELNTDVMVRWKFNENYIYPTFYPDVKITANTWRSDGQTCHFAIINGNIYYFWNCYHKYASKVIELSIWPYKSFTYAGIEE